MDVHRHPLALLKFSESLSEVIPLDLAVSVCFSVLEKQNKNVIIGYRNSWGGTTH